MYKKYFDAARELSATISEIDPLDSDSIIKMEKYLEWQKKQHEFYIKESAPLNIPQGVFKNKISTYEYDEHKGILSKYYYKHKQDDYYLKKKIIVNNSDAQYLLNKMILVEGKVVWIDFGFNVGCEFGGTHPGVILKNLGLGLIVAPLSTGVKKASNQIDVSKVYGFKARNRYTDITRITPISVYRVDLSSNIGNIHRKKLNEIKSTVINYWQKVFRISL